MTGGQGAGGSNPLIPTNKFKDLQLTGFKSFFLLAPFWHHYSKLPSFHLQLIPTCPSTFFIIFSPVTAKHNADFGIFYPCRVSGKMRAGDCVTLQLEMENPPLYLSWFILPLIFCFTSLTTYRLTSVGRSINSQLREWAVKHARRRCWLQLEWA